MRKKFKRAKKYNKLQQFDQSSDNSKSSVGSSVRQKLKKLVKFNRQFKHKTPVPKMPFENVHQQYGQRIYQTNEDEDN